MLAEPDYRQFADVDTPSGNFGNEDAFSSSRVDSGLSALNISDVSVIASAETESQILEQALTFSCADCGMVCTSSASLKKHQVFNILFILWDCVTYPAV